MYLLLVSSNFQVIFSPTVPHRLLPLKFTPLQQIRFCLERIRPDSYFGFSSGSGSLRARPTGFFSASSAVTRWNSASTFPWRIQSKSFKSFNKCLSIWLYSTRVPERTVSSPDLLRGHQPLDLFCWKMEILSVPSVNISTLHDFAVFAPRGKQWRSNSTVPTRNTRERT